MKPFVVNSHGRLVFPANFLGELDFAVLRSLDQFTAVIGRDFESKAPTGTEILARVESGAYSGRYELLRDVAQNMFWVNRYSLTMYDKRPTRWRDLPRGRSDVFLPVVTPWEDGERKVAAVRSAYDALPATWDAEVEDRAFGLLFDVFAHRRHHATELPPVKPTPAEALATPGALTFVLPEHDPDYPTYSFEEILDCNEDVPELEALMRWAMVLHNQYPWDRARTELREVSAVGDDEFVIAFHPRSRDVAAFLRRVRSEPQAAPSRAAAPVTPQPPATPYPPVRVREAFAVMPKLAALAVVRGEFSCTNEDVVRNTSFSWSPMAADEIRDKTGVEARTYSARNLEDLALDAARAALAHSGHGPAEIGAVLVSTCTSKRLIPSVSTWLSGELGLAQTHCSADIVAACAGLPYGLGEAVRQLQEVRRPVLLVCVEKFSDTIGSVRTSRMLFGDGAAALVVTPAAEGELPDVEVFNTYAGGPQSEVNSIIWPNPDFDNNITVYGPEVRNLAGRYLNQMIEELRAQADPDDPGRTLLDSIGLIVPHQANKTMILKLATSAGLSPDQLFFNIASVGNVSAASIPLAIHDAVAEGAITEPTRVFAPGFGAGAVGGYVVLRVDPAIVAKEGSATPAPGERAPSVVGSSSEDFRTAFGE